jgi:transposase
MIKSYDKKFVFGVRLQLVRHAQEHGIKPTARAYGASRNTVRKWLRRYDESGTAGMVEQSRAPQYIPHKTSKEVEGEVLKTRRKLPGWGAKRLKRDFDIACSHGAISRILKEHGLLKPRRKKKKNRRSLRELKDKFRAFERNCVDTKHLYDIVYYWPQMRILGLPKYQYTFRDMKLGAMFLGYSKELSLSHATLFGEVIGVWLGHHGVRTKGTVWQTDGGSEFIGSWQKKGKSAYIKGIESFGAEHFQIPKVTYNADVETVHNTIEFEFFDIEGFGGWNDFFAKVSTYSLYYNCLRKNSNRKDRSPLDILRETEEEIDSAVLALPALDLDKLLAWKLNKVAQGGQHVPGMS